MMPSGITAISETAGRGKSGGHKPKIQPQKSKTKQSCEYWLTENGKRIKKDTAQGLADFLGVSLGSIYYSDSRGGMIKEKNGGARRFKAKKI